MNKEEIQKALEIIREPITVNYKEYHYFDGENYSKLINVYENCLWFINNVVEEYQKAIDKTMSEKMDLEHNWNELKKYMIKEQARIVVENTNEDEFIYTDLLNKMQELERGRE